MPVSIANEVPFEIPESWAWARIKDIITRDVGGGTPDKSNPAYWNGNIPWMSVKDFSMASKGFIEDTIDHISEEGVNNSSTNIIDTEAIIICTRMGLGRTARLMYPTAINQDLRAIWLSDWINDEYFLYFYSTLKITGSGVTVKGIKRDELFAMLIPVPPYDEQVRIVSVINKYLPLISEYEKKQASLNELNRSFPEQLKKSILQIAVQGKLVEQDQSDEPASALLERIRTEKERLIAAGKIKRDKNESIIYRRDNSHYEKINGIERCIDDEIPFEIPESWEWARASSLGKMIRGKGIKRSETVDAGLPCVRYGEIYTSYNVSFSETKSFITPELDESCLHFSKGDVIFTLTGENNVDIAKAVTYVGEGSVAAGGDMAFWTAHGMNPLYLVYCMASPYCIEQKRRTATGDIIVHISTDKIGKFLVPIPPLEEQHRLVNAVNEVFNTICSLIS